MMMLILMNGTLSFFYEPNKNLRIKTLIDEQECILENTDKKYNC